jgi:alpha-ketoglutarate-dependent taurine dioxygenase
MTDGITLQALTFVPDLLSVTWSDGRRTDFTSLWLADNDPVHRDAHSGQRLIDLADLPGEVKIRQATMNDAHVRIDWQGGAPPTSIAIAWLASQRQRPAAGSARPVTFWGDAQAMDARSDCAWLTLQQLRDRDAYAATWFRRLGLEGLAFVSEVPARDGAILDAVAPIGLVQETNYGRLFDVRSVAKAENLAYTDLGLGLHTDNPYRDPVPGFQVLHCILPAADGGENLFADGFAMAEHLRLVHPEAFAVLTQYAVPFEFRARDVELYAERPMIQLGMQGEIVAVHYNNRSIAPLPPCGLDVAGFYDAYRCFASHLRLPDFQLRMRMDKGDMVVFDNWRVLHARTSFSAARHLQGCYLTKDSVYSRIALESKHESVR